MRGRQRERGLYIGMMAEHAAERDGATRILLDRPVASFPDAGTSITVADLARFTATLADRLYAAGVRAGDQVGLYKTHDFDIVLLACALGRLGAVPVMISPTVDGDTVAAMLAMLSRPHLLTDESTIDRELASVPLADLTASVILAAGRHPGAASLPEIGTAPARPPVRLHPSAPAMISHTSGTTGVPKLIVNSAETLWQRFRPQNMLAGLLRTKEPVGFCLSFVHSRLYSGLAVVLERGLPALVAADPSPPAVADLFVRDRPGLVETFPNAFIAWEGLAEDPRGPLSNVRCYTSTFDAMHPRTMAKLLNASRRRLPIFVQFYAQSEIGPIATRFYTAGIGNRSDARCVGYPLPFMTHVRIRSEPGTRPSAQQPGAIEVRSRGRALTYLGQQERYDRQLDGQWWRTGDVGYRTRLGCLHMLDREVDHIPAVASTLALEDIILARLPQLTEVVIIPGGDGPALPVVCTEQDRPLDPAAWQEATKDLQDLAAPLHRRLEDLPRTSTWKVRRLELARQLAEAPDGVPSAEPSAVPGRR
ncbi:MAG: AMP-binding protein [Mycobacteriales bacterium]